MAAHLKPSAAAKRGSDAKPADVRKPLPRHAGARLTARVALAMTLVAAALWTASDFLPPLIWAVILVIAVWPPYARFAHAVSDEPSSLAAFVFTALIGLVLIFPIALATWQIAQQSDVLFAWIKQSQDKGIAVPDWVARLPIAADALQQWWRANLTDPKAAAGWLQSINADKAAEFFKTFGGQLINRAFMFFVSLLALFVLLRNGRWIAQASSRPRTASSAIRAKGSPARWPRRSAARSTARSSSPSPKAH